jgi:hypothetical protein
MGSAPKAGHILGQDLEGASVTAIADQKHHGVGAEHPPSPVQVEVVKRVADTGPTGPILHPARHSVQGPIDRKADQWTSDACQVGTEGKGRRDSL